MEESIKKKKKRQKKAIFIYGNLAEIFSEARSGTIAHKNKKNITAVTHTIMVQHS